MDIRETIHKRRSIRKYRKEKINLKIIYDILREANLAPSAGNLQARDFIIVDDDELKYKLAESALNQNFIAEAPIIIVVCANLNRIKPYGKRGLELYCIQDSAVAIDHILLLAVNQGFGTCWIGAFNEKKVSKILKLPEYIRPTALVPIGYPAEDPDPTPRIPIEKLIHYNNW